MRPFATSYNLKMWAETRGTMRGPDGISRPAFGSFSALLTEDGITRRVLMTWHFWHGWTATRIVLSVAA